VVVTTIRIKENVQQMARHALTARSCLTLQMCVVRGQRPERTQVSHNKRQLAKYPTIKFKQLFIHEEKFAMCVEGQ
jgi:hypothetical protein